ncbi:host cell division inhibitor Icd-like protein [Escherichia coli]|uniref:host cell division inhibitor Icd-like protein n=1 Tax=Escherichia sp. 8.2195 TaxID=2723303 RepID=UPI002E2301D6|nr:host cell division inhibitor Icd-like protein [Escherichia coli]MEC9829989.1 host cell division inhibitor Icd-like protein [Escherichia coli]
MNPALLSPSSFTDSMPSKASCGIRIEICFDLSLIVFFAMCILLNKRCDSVYTKKNHKKYLTCDSVKFNLNHTSVRGCKRQRPELFAAVAGRLTKPLNEVTIMAGAQHTQTHPKFIYTFLAVHRDCMADGKNTVHVAADTLVDACEMLNDMGYISATWKGREENTLFIQKCENNFIWRFIALSTAQPRVIHIEATSEQEARQQSPDGCVMVFAAHIRQEVEHV